MRFVSLILACGLIIGCDPDDSADITVFNVDMKAQLSGNSIMVSLPLDINDDDHSDYLFNLINRHEQSFHITIHKIPSYLQQINPFDPQVFIDTETDPINIGSIIAYPRIKYYSKDQMIRTQTTSEMGRAVLLMENEFESTGIKFIPIALKKSDNLYYGWMELEFADKSVTIKRVGLSSVPGKRVKAGEGL